MPEEDLSQLSLWNKQIETSSLVKEAKERKKRSTKELVDQFNSSKRLIFLVFLIKWSLPLSSTTKMKLSWKRSKTLGKNTSSLLMVPLMLFLLLKFSQPFLKVLLSLFAWCLRMSNSLSLASSTSMNLSDTVAKTWLWFTMMSRNIGLMLLSYKTRKWPREYYSEINFSYWQLNFDNNSFKFIFIL